MGPKDHPPSCCPNGAPMSNYTRKNTFVDHNQNYQHKERNCQHNGRSGYVGMNNHLSFKMGGMSSLSNGGSGGNGGSDGIGRCNICCGCGCYSGCANGNTRRLSKYGILGIIAAVIIILLLVDTTTNIHSIKLSGEAISYQGNRQQQHHQNGISQLTEKYGMERHRALEEDDMSDNINIESKRIFNNDSKDNNKKSISITDNTYSERYRTKGSNSVDSSIKSINNNIEKNTGKSNNFESNSVYNININNIAALTDESDRFRLPIVVGNLTHGKSLGLLERQPGDSSCGQDKRQKLLQDKCEFYRKKGGEPTLNPDILKGMNPYRMILVDDMHKVLYCEVPKVACTSWKVYLANLSGKVDPLNYTKLHELVHDTTYYPKVGFKYLKDFNQKEREYRLKNYFKFLVVRNPIARLISAYENKLVMVTDQSKFYQDTVGTFLIKKYRKNPSKQSLKFGRDAKLEELIELLLDKKELFLHRFDAHWWKIQSICYPCLFKYDYIAKIETIEQDLNFLLDKISPPNSQRPKFPYLNPTHGRTDQAKFDKYLANVKPDLVERLKEFYELDNSIFGYSLNDNAKECH